ncbi:Protein BTG3 [Halotydeus destructor]|nr:Protein BTG3 [Halotydeus destructor]
MKDEISAAADFLARLVGKNETLPKEKVQQFREGVNDILTDKFKDHWFPDKPTKGQAYRCIRINGNIRHEPALELVCKNIGIAYADLMMPLELTLWIDPEDVTCRFGEHKGSYCIVANFRDGNKENYVDQINVDELEQKSVERAKQASFDLVNSRKRKARGYLKSNGFTNSSSGLYSSVDYNNGLATTTSSSYFSPHGTGGFYGSSPKFGSSYGSSPSHSIHQTTNSPMFTSNYSVSPAGGRGVSGSLGTPFRGQTSFTNAPSNFNGKFSRGLHTAFNNAASLSFGSYQQQSNDRYHWINKSIVKA